MGMVVGSKSEEFTRDRELGKVEGTRAIKRGGKEKGEAVLKIGSKNRIHDRGATVILLFYAKAGTY